MKDQFNQEDKTLDVQQEITIAQPKPAPLALGQ
jgi:hypothetical protein